MSGLRPFSVLLTEADPEPDPASTGAVAEVRVAAEVPYSNRSVVLSPPGFTLPLNVAVVDPTAEACPVVAVTDACAVVNSSSAPSVVPDEFAATSRNM